MSKNIVICCDGTGNQYGAANSNVVTLYSMLERNTDNQIAFYDPGVGTFSVKPAVTRAMRDFWKVLGLAFGLGLTRNILTSYSFIMENYKEGDQVFLIGFSRGAYTARAIAALLHKCGVLGPGNFNLLPYAMDIFRNESDPQIVEGFKATFAHPCPIHFLGVWDTVTSVGWVLEPFRLPYTTENPSVLHVRHAASIDERRAFYRQNLWRPSPGQDVEQVWFSGVHSDVGGSYPEKESGLAKLSLEWMAVEAARCGLLLDPAKAKEMIYGDPTCQPDYRAQIHKSLHGIWWLGEIWPKLTSMKTPTGYHRRPRLNLGRRRIMEPGARIYEPVMQRIAEKVDGYAPSNLPAEHTIEPRRYLGDVFPGGVGGEG